MRNQFDSAARAVAALPNMVRIGPFDYAIEKMSSQKAEATRRWGECSNVEGVIRISTSFPSAAMVASVFLHECLHAIYRIYGILDEDKEERIVDVIATGITALHRDNPWLAKWLAENIK